MMNYENIQPIKGVFPKFLVADEQRHTSIAQLHASIAWELWVRGQRIQDGATLVLVPRVIIQLAP